MRKFIALLAVFTLLLTSQAEAKRYGIVEAQDGTVGAPSITNDGDTDTGCWFPASNTFACSVAGVEIWRIVSPDSNSVLGIGVTPSSWDSLYDGLQVGAVATFTGTNAAGAGSQSIFANNWLYDSVHNRSECMVADESSYVYQQDGAFYFASAAACASPGDAVTLSNKLIIASTGEVTKPLNPAFGAGLSGNQSNVTGDGTAYSVTGAIWSEWYDKNADFSNGTLTAPVSGVYIFGGQLYIYTLSASYTPVIINLVTTTRIYTLVGDTSPAFAGYRHFAIPPIMVDMTATNTAYLTVTISGSTKTLAVGSDSTFFGALLQ